MLAIKRGMGSQFIPGNHRRRQLNVLYNANRSVRVLHCGTTIGHTSLRSKGMAGQLRATRANRSHVATAIPPESGVAAIVAENVVLLAAWLAGARPSAPRPASFHSRLETTPKALGVRTMTAQSGLHGPVCEMASSRPSGGASLLCFVVILAFGGVVKTLRIQDQQSPLLKESPAGDEKCTLGTTADDECRAAVVVNEFALILRASCYPTDVAWAMEVYRGRGMEGHPLPAVSVGRGLIPEVRKLAIDEKRQACKELKRAALSPDAESKTLVYLTHGRILTCSEAVPAWFRGVFSFNGIYPENNWEAYRKVPLTAEFIKMMREAPMDIGCALIENCGGVNAVLCVTNAPQLNVEEAPFT
ncbi:hypothetical protein BESB_039070 [Besnoitia besnoiti]|uniref:Uncharacterized protein n=1 Tax=Besnoitia besnoiti TaxID=94643 RepID=A0A2A9MHS5_BESBE|nr:hypothetical protein BESB_039070 [Besnoitia besnoiti]PFH37449.1 hypothetical protein BESB_039070 [Besnoitia besnoiti]